jgi:hypothetical protein
MILKRSQQQAYNNIIKYGKAFIFWGRQTGKSYLLSKIIQTYIETVKNEDIIFFCGQINHIDIIKSTLIKDINKYIRPIGKSGRKQKKNEIFLINNNYLTICSIKEYDYYLLHLTPSLIIYDDFLSKDISHFDYLIRYIRESNCKVIFTSTEMSMLLIKILDINNDYYINIIPDDSQNEIDTLIMDQLLYKPDELLDYDDVIFKRRKKLKQLKLLSEKNDI